MSFLRTIVTLVAAIAACAVAAAPAAALPLPAGTTALLSGQPSLFDAYPSPVGDAEVTTSSVSEDGRYVAFASTSDGLLAGDDDRAYAIYRKDMDTGEVILVSRRDGANGEPSHGYCGSPSISDDGKRIAFACDESLDPANDANGHEDVYVRTPATNTTTLVSRVGASGPASNGSSYEPVLSQDGDYVAFTSTSNDLVTGSTSPRNVYRRHVPSGDTVIVGRADGVNGDQLNAYGPSITDDGELVAFATQDKAVAADTNNGHLDVYVRDVQNGTSTLASRKGSGGTMAAVGNSHSYSPSISGNGLGVAFESFATNLDARDTGGEGNVYRHVLSLGTSLVDVDKNNAKSGSASRPSLDDGATVVSFLSTATGFDPADTNPDTDVYVRNMLANQGIALATRANGPGGAALNLEAEDAAIAGDSLHVVAELEEGGGTPDVDPRRRGVIHRDLGTNATRAVARPAGTDPFINEGDDSGAAALSADGRIAAFRTEAAALGVGPAADYAIVARNRLTGEVTLVSRADGPDGEPFGDMSSRVSVSADGRRVAFSAAQREGQTRQVYVRDLAQRRTFLASRGNGPIGAPGDARSSVPRLDADGTRVVFRTGAKNLTGDDTDATEDIHLRDLETNQTILVSRADGPGGLKGDYQSDSPDINASGTKVVFLSSAKNLVGDADKDTQNDVFVRDVAAGSTRLIDATPAGTKGNEDVSNAPSIDAAGDRIAFSSPATNLGAAAAGSKVFVRDLAAGTLTIQGRGTNPVISPDGGHLLLLAEDGAVVRRDIATGELDAVAQRGDDTPSVGDISTNGACASFSTHEPLVGPARDHTDAYLRVFAADCGDPVPVQETPAGDGPVVAGGPQGTPLDRIAPLLTRVRLERKRFRRARGTRLRFRSSEAGTLRVVVQSVRRHGGRVRARRIGTLQRQIAAGPGRVALRGRIGRRALRLGKYRLRVSATDAAGNRSRTVTRRFTVVGRRR
jgi:Tol biopolymer transport system component